MKALQFCNAFAEQWQTETERSEGNILEAYRGCTTWTDYMVTKEESFLSRLARGMNFAIIKEYGKFDAVYYNEGDQNNILFRSDELYMHCLHVIIEHENEDRVEQEMHKLLFHRSPLKVLIFYDWPEYKKAEKQNYARWLDDKLSQLFVLGKAVNEAWLEAEDTEYLFLVGNTIEENKIPQWRYLISKPVNFEASSSRLINLIE